MRYSALLTSLQNLTNVLPKQADLCRILDCQRSAMSARMKRDSEFSLEEIMKIEDFYGVSLVDTDKNTVEIDYIRVCPSCGTGSIILDEPEVTPVRIGKEIIKDLWKTKAEDLKLFKASGDSMQPVIETEDILLVDTSKTDFNNGGIFVLTINNDWFVKRLRLRITGELDIISENDKYPVETLKPDTPIQINIVGRVIKNLSRGL